MLRSLAKHVALISGGGSGLGRATAEHLVKAGARVVLIDLPTSPGAAVASELGANAVFCATDVLSEEQARDLRWHCAPAPPRDLALFAPHR